MLQTTPDQREPDYKTETRTENVRRELFGLVPMCDHRLPEPARLQGIPMAARHDELVHRSEVLAKRATDLAPRALALLRAPPVVRPADPPDNPRPQERLARTLDDKVRGHEHRVHVAVAAHRLAELVGRGRGERVRPDGVQLVEEVHRGGLGFVRDVWPRARAEAVAWRTW